MIALLLLACSSPKTEEPPPDMEELTWMLLRDFGTDAAVEEAELLAAWIDEEIVAPEDGYVLDVPPAENVADFELSPNLVLDEMAGAMVLRRVRGSIAMHAAVVPEADQRFADDSYDAWSRTITQGDEQGWNAGEPLVADDDIVKNAGLGILLPYPMLREYRWEALGRGDCVLTRSVIYDEGWADEHNGIVGGFTIELWMPDGDEMIWMNATWTLVRSIADEAGVDKSFYEDKIVQGSTEVMIGTELYVAGEE